MNANAPTAAELHFLQPEIVLVIATVAILIAPFFSRTRVNAVSGLIALAGILIALLFSVLPQKTIGPIFNGLLTVDAPAFAWRQLLLVFMLGVLAIWFGSTRRSLPAGDAPEFFTLLITAAIGMMLMGETSNMLMLLIATEIASMPSYVLAGFQKHQAHSSEASLKFVLFGAVCTAVMIYGLSLLYGTCGSLDLGQIARSVATNGITPALAMGLLLLLVGLLFKISAVPLHFWSPDVYAGAPIDVVAFLSVASKGAGIVLLVRLTTLFITTAGDATAARWVSVVLAIIAIITTTLGTLGALRQSSVRRLLAYSSISHAGYILSAVALIDAGRPAVMAYLLIYMVMNVGAFAVLADVENQTGSDDVSAFNGLYAYAPMSALALVVCLMSMVGLPPTAGFFAKWKILAAVGHGGGWWWVVAASVAVNSIISLVFYARLLRASYFTRTMAVNIGPRSFAGSLAVACAAALILMLIFFSPLDRWADSFSDSHSSAIASPASKR